MFLRFIFYILLMLIIAAAAVAVYIFNWKQPFDAEISRINEEYDTLQTKIRRGNQLDEEIRRVTQKITDTKREVVTLLRERTKDRDLNKFLNDAERDAQDSGVILKSISIRPKTQRQRFTEIPLEFQVEGTYFQLYDFLTRIEKRGFLSFARSSMSLTGGGAARGVTISNLRDMIDGNPNVTDIAGKKVNLTKYTDSTEFPRLRIQFDGSVIIIDRSHIANFEGS
jgi:type IV pilus assembly protein PilO